MRIKSILIASLLILGAGSLVEPQGQGNIPKVGRFGGKSGAPNVRKPPPGQWPKPLAPAQLQQALEGKGKVGDPYAMLTVNTPYFANRGKLYFSFYSVGSAYAGEDEDLGENSALFQAGTVHIIISPAVAGQSYIVDCAVGSSKTSPYGVFVIEGDHQEKWPSTGESQHLVFTLNNTDWYNLELTARSTSDFKWTPWHFYYCDVRTVTP